MSENPPVYDGLQALDPLAPRVRVSISQLANGQYRAERTVEFAALDVTTDDGMTDLAQQLSLVDRVIRDHVADLVRRDRAAKEGD